MAKHLISNLKGDFIGIEDGRKKSKPRPIDFEVFKGMVRERDRLFYKEAQDKGDIATMEFLINRYK